MLFWTAGDIPILRIWLYIFGCVALEFITTDPELLADHATASIVKENFGSLPKATLTLLQAGGNSRKMALRGSRLLSILIHGMLHLTLR